MQFFFKFLPHSKMSNSNSTFRSIAPKLQEFFIQNPDIIAVANPNSSVLHTFNLLSLVEPTTNTTLTLAKLKIYKKNREKRTSNNTSQSGSVNEEEGWNDENTKLLINFLEENFSSYKKNKSNFAKMASNKIFPGKP